MKIISVLLVLIFPFVFTIASAATYTNEKGTFTNGVKHQNWGNHNIENSDKQTSKKNNNKKKKKNCKNLSKVTIFRKGEKKLEIPFKQLFKHLEDRNSGKKLKNNQRPSNVSEGGDGSGNGGGDGSGRGNGRGDGKGNKKGNKKTYPFAKLFPTATVIKMKTCNNNEKMITKDQFNKKPACHAMGLNRRGQLKYLECGKGNAPAKKMKTILRRITFIEVIE